MKMFAMQTRCLVDGSLLSKLRIDEQFHRAGDILARSVEKFGLFRSASLDFIFVNVRINNFNEETGLLLPTNFLRNSTWRHKPKQKEFVCKCDLNVEAWSWRGKDGLVEYLSEREVFLDVHRLVAAAVAQVALEFGDTPESVAKLLEGLDVDIEALAAAKDATKVKKNHYAASEGEGSNEVELVSLEITFSDDNVDFDAGFAKRTAIRKLIEETLAKRNLGRFDGASSGADDFNLGFKVKDFGMARRAVLAALKKAGYDPSRFTIEEL